MINRVILLVIDGFGIGALPDAADYGDADANTLAHLSEAAGGMSLPNLETLGIGHLAQIAGVRPMTQMNGCFGRMGFASQGADSVTGYWETCGVIQSRAASPFRCGFPLNVIQQLEQAFGRKVIGNRAGSLKGLVEEHGAEHLSHGAPIVWTDGGWTCHVAAHPSMLPVVELQQRCREIRKLFKDTAGPQRIVAHSFTGEAGAFQLDASRQDFIAEPPVVTMLDVLNRSGQIVMGVGKAHDLFAGRGFTRAIPALTAAAAFEETVKMLKKMPRGLLYVSMNLFPEEPAAAARALEEFDRRLPELFEDLRVGDLLVLTSDHGRDLTRGARTPTREYVPILTTGPKLAQGVNLGTRATAADLGQTIVEALRAERFPIGESFFDALRVG
ncbi:phosphopentomutase [Nitrospira sp. NS4]|uniref:phosphopentomutase n=1 Tax=Nitrospira sp. NS4 TaxID=3414498 RepID=UPI003C2C5666